MIDSAGLSGHETAEVKTARPFAQANFFRSAKKLCVIGPGGRRPSDFGVEHASNKESATRTSAFLESRLANSVSTGQLAGVGTLCSASRYRMINAG